MTETPASPGGGIRALGFGGNWFWLVLVGCAILAGLLFYATFGELNADEGFYGLACRAVMGGAMPYRDFGYTQTPLLPYLNGAVMKLIGFGFMEQRLLNVFWAAVSIGVGGWFLWRRGGHASVLVFGCLMLSSLGWLSFAAKGKTYGLVGFLLLGMAVIGLSRWNSIHRVGAILLCGAVAVGCRLPVLPLVGFAVIGLMCEGRSWPRALIIGFSGMLIGVVLLLPFALADWSNFVFWNLEFHLSSDSVRDLAYRFEGFAEVALAVWVVGLAVGILRWRSFRWHGFESWLSVGLGVTLIANLGSSKGYGEYAVPFVPIVALLVASSVTPWLQTLRLRSLLLLILPLVVAANLFRPDLDPIIRGNLDAVATALGEVVPADEVIFGTMPIVALESGHPFPSELLMGKFVLTEDFSDEEAARRHLITPQQMAARLRSSEFGAMVFSAYSGWNFAWSVPSYSYLSKEGMFLISRAMEENYEFGFGNKEFVVFLPRGRHRLSDLGLGGPAASADPTRPPRFPFFRPNKVVQPRDDLASRLFCRLDSVGNLAVVGVDLGHRAVEQVSNGR